MRDDDGANAGFSEGVEKLYTGPATGSPHGIYTK
jgi:hypothetical protein